MKEVPYVLRIVVQGLLPGLPPDLADEAQELSARLNTAVPGLARLNAAVHGNDRDQAAAGLNESCPACHVDIPLVDITSALCDNGHAWGKNRNHSDAILSAYLQLSHSSVFHHIFHFVYSNGANLHWLQPKSVPPFVAEDS